MTVLMVTQASRGRGIGQALRDSAANATRRRGMHHLEWSTAPDNAAARRVYDATGAQRSTWIAHQIPTR